MVLMRDLSKAQLAFQIADREVREFEVVRYRGSEGLCQLYRFEIELATAEQEVAFDDIVGKAAVLSINTEHGQRWFHGIVSRFEATGDSPELTYFRAELVPSVWLLTHRYNSRILQGRTVPEIIADVLTRAGIPEDRFNADALGRTYAAREYCVQYRETDYNFICRLMEEEGIRWYFEQTQEAHVLVLEDSDAANCAKIQGEPELPFHPLTGVIAPDEHVFRFRLGQSVRPGAVVLNDFNFANPRLNLLTAGDCGRDTGLEFFDYPGEYAEQKTGQDLAALRAEEFEAGRTVGVGQSNSARLAPGRTFELTEHPGGLGGAYLLTSVMYEGKQSRQRSSAGLNGRNGTLDAGLHQALLATRREDDESIRLLSEAILQIAARLKSGDPTAHRALTQWLYHAGQVSKDLPSIAEAQGGSPLEALSIPNLLEDTIRSGVVDEDAPVYTCRFECIPASVTYRPPRVTPWPQMRGTQTARVVGPDSEEIHTDEYGRVKVHFNWDREGQFDDTSSCWIRVSQGLAGGGYGMMFLPRVGQEVIVDFLEGDPDKPIIIGRVYNADHMPPYKLPDEKTKSCIKTHSSKGGGGTNEIRFEDLKDQEQILMYAQKDLHIRVNNDRVENVDHDHHLTVKENKFELVKKGKNSEVKLDLQEKIGGHRSQEVKGKVSDKVGGTYTLDVGQDAVHKIGAGHKHEVTGTYGCKAASIKLEASAGIEFKCGGSSILLTPAAIFIVGGPMVNINSGNGPPVGPVTAMASSPTAPEAPVDADTVEPGKDTTYSGGEAAPAGEIDQDTAGHLFEPTEVEPRKNTWIEIELVDEAGQPVPGERYEITAPDGETIRKGSLNDQGQAHVCVPEPAGLCQISFPNLDAAAWEQL